MWLLLEQLEVPGNLESSFRGVKTSCELWTRRILKNYCSFFCDSTICRLHGAEFLHITSAFGMLLQKIGNCARGPLVVCTITSLPYSFRRTLIFTPSGQENTFRPTLNTTILLAATEIFFHVIYPMQNRNILSTSRNVSLKNSVTAER